MVLLHLTAAAYYGIAKSRSAHFQDLNNDAKQRFVESRRTFNLLQPYLYQGGSPESSSLERFTPIELIRATGNPMFQWFVKKHWEYWIANELAFNDVEGYDEAAILFEVRREIEHINSDKLFGVSFSAQYPSLEDRVRLIQTLVKAALSHYVKAQSGTLFYAKTSNGKRLQGVSGKSSFLLYVVALIKSTGPFLLLTGAEFKDTCTISSFKEFYDNLIHSANGDEKGKVLTLIKLLNPDFEHTVAAPIEELSNIENNFNELAIDRSIQHSILLETGEIGWRCLSALHHELLEYVDSEYRAMVDISLPTDADILTLVKPENSSFIESESMVPETFTEGFRVSLFKFIWIRANIVTIRSRILVSLLK